VAYHKLQMAFGATGIRRRVISETLARVLAPVTLFVPGAR
jgi:hypothetical protein